MMESRQDLCGPGRSARAFQESWSAGALACGYSVVVQFGFHSLGSITYLVPEMPVLCRPERRASAGEAGMSASRRIPRICPFVIQIQGVLFHAYASQVASLVTIEQYAKTDHW